MYCPNCASPIDGVKFCRGCGTNVSLVPQAMTGRLQEEVPDLDSGRRRRRRPATIQGASSSFFTGIGFILVAIAIGIFMPGGSGWWFWMLIPGFASVGSGVGQYLRIQAEEKERRGYVPNLTMRSMDAPVVRPQVEAPKATTTSNLEKGSVTEHTTRHLEN